MENSIGFRRNLCNHNFLLHTVGNGDKREFICLDCCKNVELIREEYEKRKVIDFGENVSEETIKAVKDMYEYLKASVEKSIPKESIDAARSFIDGLNIKKRKR